MDRQKKNPLEKNMVKSLLLKDFENVYLTSWNNHFWIFAKESGIGPDTWAPSPGDEHTGPSTQDQ